MQNVDEIFKNNNDYKKLKQAIVKLHKIWVLEESKQNAGSLDVMQEYGVRRKLAENKIKCLNEQLRNDSRNFEKENSRILKENVMLIQEINHLKTELHSREQQVKESDLEVENLKKDRPAGSRAGRVQSAHMLYGRQINKAKEEIHTL